VVSPSPSRVTRATIPCVSGGDVEGADSQRGFKPGAWLFALECLPYHAAVVLHAALDPALMGSRWSLQPTASESMMRHRQQDQPPAMHFDFVCCAFIIYTYMIDVLTTFALDSAPLPSTQERPFPRGPIHSQLW
jgi:hypothetical protein